MCFYKFLFFRDCQAWFHFSWFLKKLLFLIRHIFQSSKFESCFKVKDFFGLLRLICWRCFFRHLVFSLYMDIYGLIWTWFCRSILYLHALSCGDRWSAFADRWSPLADCWSTCNESESPLLLELENSNSKEKFGKYFFWFWLSYRVYASEGILRYLNVSFCIFAPGSKRYI